MAIKNLFKKDINERIQGVIMAEQTDEDSIYNELSEFVITKEIDKHIRKFFGSYLDGIDNKKTTIGVWISGFFGSGKSHLLKIFSYILGNKEVKGKKAIDFMGEKLVDDSMLLADIERAVGNGTTDTILFNIDARAEGNSSKDSILVVFMKVFNEFLGYYGYYPWLAEFEMNLDHDNKFGEFKENYKKFSGKEWIEDRKKFSLPTVKDFFVKAVVETNKCSEESVREAYSSLRDDYTLDIKKFSNLVKLYCDKKGKNHKVIFLVDEIGQYIGDNSDLMLNLQTIVEELGNELKGKAWVVVTSQATVDSITEIKGRDFSKIQGRFPTRLSLSSENTDEVIKKRLLEKNDEGKKVLADFYQKNQAIIKNHISFSSNTAEMKIYKNEEDFVESYPFIPYQFHLLQKVFEKIRVMGTAGAHISDGNRSMLNGFQEAGILIWDNKVGTIVNFSMFYDTVESFISGEIKRTINKASDNNFIKELDVKILKVLFMIKYVDELPKNLENLTTLMISNVDEDKKELRNQIAESLNRLISQTLIHKNGEDYMFLSNEEQDINKQIKEMEVNNEEVLQHIGKVFFDEIYRTNNNKFQYKKHNNYFFNKYVDNLGLSSKQYDIGVKVSTSWDDKDKKGGLIYNQQNMLVIELDDDGKVLDYIKGFIQIEKFVKRNTGSEQSSSIKNIIDSKINEIQDIKKLVKELIITGTINGTYYINGHKQEVGTKKDPNETINSLMTLLIENVYSKVSYINNHFMKQEDIFKILKSNSVEGDTLFETENNKLALEEVEKHIDFEISRSKKISLKDIIDKFSGAPYGWEEFDISGVVAVLFVLNKIQLKYSNENLTKDDKNILTYLTNSREYDKLIINIKKQLDTSMMLNVKKIISNVFGIADLPSEQDELFYKVKEIISKEINELSKYEGKYSNKKYPGKKIVDGGLELLNRFMMIPEITTLFNQIISSDVELSEYESKVSIIKGFFDKQVSIFDKAVDKIDFYGHEESYLDDSSKTELKNLTEIVNSENPFGLIKNIMGVVNTVDSKYNEVLTAKKDELSSKVSQIIENLTKEAESKGVDEEITKSVIVDFYNVLSSVETINECTRLDSLERQLETKEKNGYEKIYDSVSKKSSSESKNKGKNTKIVKVEEFVDKNVILKNKDEIDTYTENLNKKLKKLLGDDEIKIL